MIKNMKKLLVKILSITLLGSFFLRTEQSSALIPYYFYPSSKNLEKESLSIGKNAYQLLYLGQIEDGLNLAKLAVKIYEENEKLWLILSEAQIVNELYENALISLKKAEKINPDISEIYFARSSIFIKQSKLKYAEIALKAGLSIEPDNHNALFQLGNIFLMENNYQSAIKFFDKAIEIKPEFWAAINNKGLAYFEQNNIIQSIKFFEEAISIEENAEPLLGLASCLRVENINSALLLAKRALKKNPNYVDYNYRKEQLWGENLQASTEILFKNEQLQEDIKIAKSKVNKI